MIIDAHTHIDNPIPQGVEDLLASMNAAGIDYSVVISESNPGSNSSNLKELLAACQSTERIKIIGDCVFDTLDVEGINILTGYLRDEKIIGLKFYLGYDEYFAHNEKLFPLYEYCQEHNKPVMFHTGALETGSTGLLKYSHPLTIDEVAHHFPKLKIIMAHMGNPWLMDAAAVMAKNENVYTDMSAFFEENQPITHEEIEIFINRLSDMRLFLGSYEKFLFGSDYPLYNQKEYLAAVEALNLTPKEKNLVLWENAKKIFNLSI